MSDDSKTKTRQLLREIGELESIGDSCYRLARTIYRRDQLGKTFDSDQQGKLIDMISLCHLALQQMNTVLSKPINEQDIRETYFHENRINDMRDSLRAWNINAVNDREYDYATGTAFGDLVGELEKLGDYIVNVVEARFGEM